MPPSNWPDEIHRVLAAQRVRIVGYVPDAGHKRLIELCHADAGIRAVPLTTEEEGIGLAAGAWLGGEKTALLMQSSGVGNLINVLGTVKTCRFPLLMIVTMRGERGEFNPWQLPMGRATAAVLGAMGVSVEAVSSASEAASTIETAVRKAFDAQESIAVLISQRMIGIKSFEEQANQ